MEFASYSWSSLAGHCLGGVIGSEGPPEWEWSRVQDALGIKGTRDHHLLWRNRESFQSEMEAAEIPSHQLHYRGREDADPHKTGHTVESRAMLLIFIVLLGRKKYKADVKQTGALLLIEMVRAAATSRDLTQTLDFIWFWLFVLSSNLI